MTETVNFSEKSDREQPGERRAQLEHIRKILSEIDCEHDVVAIDPETRSPRIRLTAADRSEAQSQISRVMGALVGIKRSRGESIPSSYFIEAGDGSGDCVEYRVDREWLPEKLTPSAISTLEEKMLSTEVVR